MEGSMEMRSAAIGGIGVQNCAFVENVETELPVKEIDAD
jgi:hypothetical protein